MAALDDILREEVAKAQAEGRQAAATPPGPAPTSNPVADLLNGDSAPANNPVSTYRNAAKRMITADPNVAAARSAQIMKVASAYATKQDDPTGAKTQGPALNNILQGFGLGSVPVPSGRQ